MDAIKNVKEIYTKMVGEGMKTTMVAVDNILEFKKEFEQQNGVKIDLGKVKGKTTDRNKGIYTITIKDS